MSYKMVYPPYPGFFLSFQIWVRSLVIIRIIKVYVYFEGELLVGNIVKNQMGSSRTGQKFRGVKYTR